MVLKVIRYKNYGCTMTGGGDPEPYEDKFYFSFYELNNKEIIVLNLHEYFEGDILTFTDSHFSYTKQELKSGEIISYKFGKAKAKNGNEMSKEFFDWFESCPPANDLKEHYALYANEEKCVKDFFLKHIEGKKDVKTGVVEVFKLENGCKINT